MPRSPVFPLQGIPDLTHLYKLGHLTPASTDEPQLKPSTKFNNIISLIRRDITSLRVSAIVNAANRSLRGGGGVDGAIHARAGPDLLRECKTLGGCETGSAKITDAYDLAADKVIHAVGPMYATEMRKHVDRPAELLRECYETALKLAVDHKCKTIAFPCISTGVYGYPSRLAACEVLRFVRGWLERNEDSGFGGVERIIFCCFERKDENAYEEMMPQYFPPAEDDHVDRDEDVSEAAELEKIFPAAPVGELSEPGQPDLKRQKTTVNDEKEWEEIEKSEECARNGNEDALK